MNENLPERITFRDSVRSMIDIGKVALAEFIGRADEKLANAINRQEDES